MVGGRIELRFRENAGAARTIVLNPGDARVEVRGVTLVVRIESLVDGAIVRAAVSNRVVNIRLTKSSGRPVTGCVSTTGCSARGYSGLRPSAVARPS